jgi:hypothetical protein
VFKLSTLQKCVIIAMLAFAGLAVYWMMSGASGQASKSPVTQSLTRAKKLCLACRIYASNHQGNLPPSLDALVPGYLADHSAFVSPLMPSEPEGYLYTPGLKDIGPVNAVVVEDKFAPRQHLRIVAYLDGSARVLPTP